MISFVQHMIIKILWYRSFVHGLKCSTMLKQYTFKVLVGNGADKETQNLVFCDVKEFQAQLCHQEPKRLETICHVVECFAQCTPVMKCCSSDGSSYRQWILLSQQGEGTVFWPIHVWWSFHQEYCYIEYNMKEGFKVVCSGVECRTGC